MNEHPLVTEYRNFSPNSAAFSARALRYSLAATPEQAPTTSPTPLLLNVLQARVFMMSTVMN